MNIELRYNGVLRGGTWIGEIVTIHTPYPIIIKIEEAKSLPDFKILYKGA